MCVDKRCAFFQYFAANLSILNIVFFYWQTAVAAQKILTYWFRGTFKDIMNNAVLYSP